MQIVQKPEWANVTIADGKLKVDFKANNTGTFRRDVVIMRSENFVDSIYVGQYDFETDIKGKYKLTYYRDTTYTTTRTLTATVKDSTITLGGMNLNLPYTFDEQTMSFVLETGSYAGKSGSDYIFTLLLDAKKEYNCNSMYGQLSHDADGNVVVPFRSVYGGMEFSTIGLVKLTDNTFDVTKFNGYYQILYRPILTRVVTK